MKGLRSGAVSVALDRWARGVARLGCPVSIEPFKVEGKWMMDSDAAWLRCERGRLLAHSIAARENLIAAELAANAARYSRTPAGKMKAARSYARRKKLGRSAAQVRRSRNLEAGIIPMPARQRAVKASRARWSRPGSRERQRATWDASAACAARWGRPDAQVAQSSKMRDWWASPAGKREKRRRKKLKGS